jgi:hypothetical protein
LRRVTTIVALALCLVGCEAASPVPAEPFDLDHSRIPADGRLGACSLGWWTGGQLVVDEDRGTSVIVESGDFATVGAKMGVLWWPQFTGRRVGNEVEVLDPDGRVVATTGQRYRIAAAFPMLEDGRLVVCGDEVTPL